MGKAKMLDEKTKRILTPGNMWAYALGVMGINLGIGLVNSYQAEFFNKMLGANLMAIAAIILVSKVISIVADFVIGHFIDNAHFKSGKMKPWIMIAIFPLIVLTMLTFSTFSFPDTRGGHAGMYIYITFITILWNISMTLSDIPSQGMLALLSPDGNERNGAAGLTNTLKSIALAAPGVFALTAVAVSAFGVDIFMAISKYLGVLAIGFGIQLFVVYPVFLRIFSKVPVWMLYAAIAEAMMVAFGTASSSATLPLTIACCEKRGISHKVTSFVIPLGATLNMDGTALLQVVAVIFLAQAYGVAVTPLIIIQVALLAIIASSTSAGIPGAGLITIALVLNGLGLSPEQLVAGFAFLFTIERITDMMRTLVNVTSDAVVAAAIADNENEINYDLLTNPKEYNEVID